MKITPSLRPSILAAALGGLLLGTAAQAAIAPGNSQASPFERFSGNGELIFTIQDPIAKASYTLDLGLDLTSFWINGQQDAGSQQFWVIDDAQWATFLAQTSTSNMRWAIAGIDTTGGTAAGGQRLFTTIKQGDETKVADFSNQQFTNGVLDAANFFTQINQTGTHGAVGQAADYAVNGSSFNLNTDAGVTYFGETGGLTPTLNARAAFDITNAVGQSSWFYYLARSGTVQGNKVTVDEFDNLGHDAYWGFTYVGTTVNSPYAGKYLLSYTLQAAGVTASTAAGQVRMSFTDYSAGLLSRPLIAPAGEFAGYRITSLVPASAVPEPGAWALMALGLLGLGLVSRRRR